MHPKETKNLFPNPNKCFYHQNGTNKENNADKSIASKQHIALHFVAVAFQSWTLNLEFLKEQSFNIKISLTQPSLLRGRICIHIRLRCLFRVIIFRILEKTFF